MIYLHNIIENTRVEGPGLRTAIWTQGCSIHCKGCMIPTTWEFSTLNGYKVEDLADKIISNKRIEGLTILGGEPFDQSEALYKLVQRIKSNSNLSIMLFTGYTSKDLEETNPYFSKIIPLLDIFIEGPYIEEKTDFSREWVGSSNQEIHFITDRYKHLEKIIYKDTNDHKIEIRLSKDGSVNINGMLPKEELYHIVAEIRSTK